MYEAAHVSKPLGEVPLQRVAVLRARVLHVATRDRPPSLQVP